MLFLDRQAYSKNFIERHRQRQNNLEKKLGVGKCSGWHSVLSYNYSNQDGIGKSTNIKSVEQNREHRNRTK